MKSSPLPSQQTAGLALFEAINTPVLTRLEAHQAAAVTAEDTRARMLAVLRTHGPLTADAAGAKLDLPPLSARPRIAELYAAGSIRPAGRGRSASGNPATLWEVVE